MKKNSIEFQLLVACLRWPLTETDRELINTLARLKLNPSLFLDLVQHHQVAPIVFRNLDDAAREEAPAELISNLRAKALTAGKYTLRRVMETIHLTEELERGGIEVRVLKGIALSIEAYHDATVQDSIDIDLLVSVPQVLEAEKILLECGYLRVVPLAPLTPRRIEWTLNHSHHFHFVHPKTREGLELHWRLTANPFKHEQFVIDETSKMRLRIGAKEIPSLAPEETFLYACVHGAEHYWNRLKWLAEVAALLRAMDHDEIRAMVIRATRFGVNAELAAAIALVNHYQLADISTAALALESSRAADRIVTNSLKAIDAGTGYSRNAIADFGAAWMAGSSLKYRRNLIEAMIIRPVSWSIIDLPDWLFLGYALLAPVALFQHRTFRSASAARKTKSRRARTSASVESGVAN